MSQTPIYTEHHPRWHRTRVSTYWWLGSWSYLAFILRELSSVFIAWFIVYLLLLVQAVSAGPEDYRRFRDWAGTPPILILNIVSLFFVIFHAVTWFNLAPRAMVLHYRGKKVPGVWITAQNYLAWAIVSALVAWLILAGY
jgi:fumarate reductase subunit C